MPHVRANGINVYYEFHGPEQAPVLVLNNGILMNASTSWLLQTPAFADHYRVLQYDLRGQGQSDPTDQEFSMDLHADDLAALMGELKLTKAHVLGISYGGHV